MTKPKAKALRIQITLHRHNPHEAMALEEIDRFEGRTRSEAVRALLQDGCKDMEVRTRALRDPWGAKDWSGVPLERGVSIVVRLSPDNKMERSVVRRLTRLPQHPETRAGELKRLVVLGALARRAAVDLSLAHPAAVQAMPAPSPTAAPVSPAPRASAPPAPVSSDRNVVPRNRAGAELLGLFAGRDETPEQVAARIRDEGVEPLTGST